MAHWLGVDPAAPSPAPRWRGSIPQEAAQAITTPIEMLRAEQAQGASVYDKVRASGCWRGVPLRLYLGGGRALSFDDGSERVPGA
jgi:hypothetical protein